MTEQALGIPAGKILPHIIKYFWNRNAPHLKGKYLFVNTYKLTSFVNTHHRQFSKCSRIILVFKAKYRSLDFTSMKFYTKPLDFWDDIDCFLLPYFFFPNSDIH